MKISRKYTEEEKQLLRKDLTMRTGSLVLCRATNGHIFKFDGLLAKDDPTEFKPYLYPMSALLDEIEEGGWQRTPLIAMWLELHGYAADDDSIDEIERVYNGFNLFYSLNGEETSIQIRIENAMSSLEKIEWLIANRFDVHGLIGKGLAYDATKHKVYSSVFVAEHDDGTYDSSEGMVPEDYELCLLDTHDDGKYYYIKAPIAHPTAYVIAVKIEDEPTILLNKNPFGILPEGTVVSIMRNERLRHEFNEMLAKSRLSWDFGINSLYSDTHRCNFGDKVYFPWFNPQLCKFVTIDGTFNDCHDIMYCATWAEAEQRTQDLNDAISELSDGYKETFTKEYEKTLMFKGE